MHPCRGSSGRLRPSAGCPAARRAKPASNTCRDHDVAAGAFSASVMRVATASSPGCRRCFAARRTPCRSRIGCAPCRVLPPCQRRRRRWVRPMQRDTWSSTPAGVPSITVTACRQEPALTNAGMLLMSRACAPRKAAAGCGAAVRNTRRSLASGLGRHGFILGRGFLSLMAQRQHAVRADMSMRMQRSQAGSPVASLHCIEVPELPSETSASFATRGATSCPFFQICSTSRASIGTGCGWGLGRGRGKGDMGGTMPRGMASEFDEHTRRCGWFGLRSRGG